MNSKAPKKVTALFQILAGWNSLRGKFIKGERLTVNLVEHVSAGWAQKPYWRVEVTNVNGQTVCEILNTALTRKTALGWAQGNYGHQKIAA